MSISGIPNSIFSPSQSSSATNTIQQEFQQLGQSLQSGNLSSAQSEFATLQQAFSQAGSSSTATTASGSTATGTASTAANSNSIVQPFNQLASDLKSGNLTAAQKDYSSIQRDFRAKGGPVRNHLHNHHRVSTGGLGSEPTSGIDGTSQNSLLQDLTQASQMGLSSTPAVAQQAYATLQQELQQFALGGNLSAQASALSAQPVVSLEA